MAWDGYLDVRGNRYRVPAACCGQPVTVSIGLDDSLRVVDAEGQCVAPHQLCPVAAGWQSIPAPQAMLWQAALQVEPRELAKYEESGQWHCAS